MIKSVEHLLPAVQVDMGGIYVKQPLPTARVQQVDPFLLLHHGTFRFRKGGKAIHQGIGPHPHRGFSPVTFVIEGELYHRDSFGHSQVARAGEVQWMNAGAGIVHSERPSQDLVDQGGSQEVIQLWINTHSSRKLIPPSYQHIVREQMPEMADTIPGLSIRLVAGTHDGFQGPAATDEELLIAWGHWEGDAAWVWKLPPGYNALIYVVRGALRIPGFGLAEGEQLVAFSLEGSAVEIMGTAGAQCIFLGGAPLDEKVVAQGPFVMNTETQILEAMRDYQMGKMGILIEEE